MHCPQPLPAECRLRPCVPCSEPPTTPQLCPALWSLHWSSALPRGWWALPSQLPGAHPRSRTLGSRLSLLGCEHLEKQPRLPFPGLSDAFSWHPSIGCPPAPVTRGPEPPPPALVPAWYSSRASHSHILVLVSLPLLPSALRPARHFVCVSPVQLAQPPPHPASLAPSCFLLARSKSQGLPPRCLGTGLRNTPWTGRLSRGRHKQPAQGTGCTVESARRAQRPAPAGSFNGCARGAGAEPAWAQRHQMNKGLPSSCASWLRQDSSSSASVSMLGCTVSTSTRCRNSIE